MSSDARLGLLLDTIVQIASGNLDARVPPPEGDDELDAISCGLNMLAEELAASHQRSQHLAAVLNAMRNVNKLVVREKDLRKLLHECCVLLVDARGYDQAWILLEQSGTNYFRVSSGSPVVTESPLTDGAFCCKEALDSDGVVTFQWPSDRCGDCPKHGECAAGTIMTVRIVHAGLIFGVLGVASHSGIEMDTEEQSLFNEVAADIGFAMHNLTLAHEHTRAVKELRRSEERYKRLFEGASEGIVIADIATGHFNYCNPAACNMLGYSEEELMQKRVADIHPPEELDHVLHEFVAQAQGLKSFAEGLPCVRKDGTRIYANFNSARIEIDGRDCNVGFFADVTAQREAERELKAAHHQLQETTAQLIQLEKMRALGELAAGVAHELNQPLNGIKIICQSILRYFDDYQKVQLRQELIEILTIIGSMAETIDRMRLFSRRSHSFKPEPINLNAVVDDALRFIRQQLHQHDIELVVDLADDLPLVRGDAVRLQQALLNIVTNSRDALDGCDKNDKQLSIKTSRDATDVFLEIRDNGTGLSEKVRDRIFEPFFTTKGPSKGTGLGLSICAKFISEHNGRIEVESAENDGAMFRIALPAGEA